MARYGLEAKSLGCFRRFGKSSRCSCSLGKSSKCSCAHSLGKAYPGSLCVVGKIASGSALCCSKAASDAAPRCSKLAGDCCSKAASDAAHSCSKLAGDSGRSCSPYQSCTCRVQQRSGYRSCFRGVHQGWVSNVVLFRKIAFAMYVVALLSHVCFTGLTRQVQCCCRSCQG